MTDLSKYKSKFEYAVRQRGMSYFNSKMVKVISFEPGHRAIFNVQGSKLYTVVLKFNQNNKLDSSCTCPYSEKGYGCKHEWASILEAQQRLFFNTPADQDAIKAHELPISTKIPNNEQVKLWRNQLQNLQNKKNEVQKIATTSFISSTSNKRIGFFVIDPILSAKSKKWVMKFYARERLRNGDLGVMKPYSMNQEQISIYEDELDRKALWSVLGMSGQSNSGYYSYEPKKEFIYLQPDIMDSLLSKLSDAKKLMILTPLKVPELLSFDTNPLQIKLSLIESSEGFLLSAYLVNETKTFLIDSSTLTYMAPYLLAGHELVCTNFEKYEEWFWLFKNTPEITVPKEDLDGFLSFYFNSQNAPNITYPDSIQVTTRREFSKVRLAIDNDPKNQDIVGQIQFLYGNEFINHDDFRSSFFSSDNRTIFKRDVENEQREATRLQETSEDSESLVFGTIQISESNLEKIIERAFSLGWEVVAFKKNVNQKKDFKATISTGIDWFDLSVGFEFSNGFIFGLPQLLQTIKSGQRFISLADGSTGLIPNEWIKKFGAMIQAGRMDGDSLRLTKIQTLFYGAELCEDKNFKSDRKFKTFQRIIEDINNVSEINIDPRFKGKLRKYQKKGVSWLNLMSKHEIGAVLADDMGLGKTVQVLAAVSKSIKSKSLIVAPKSLVFNWISEAKKFTPHLMFHDHTGSDRMERLKEFDKAHVAITTYQTFRQDIEFFKEKEFEYFILDEAHYIKNSESQAFMACKLIKARKKIALTGTPVENSLKDLFSILSVVNPGLISDSLADKYANETNPEAIGLLSKSLRPFILRRTKDEVLKDLPKKTEQVIYCELSVPERKKYNELKNYYWNNLSGKIDEKGFQRSKIEILEALLRLRQASCHPGLLNSTLASGSSAKFDLLLEKLETVINDGHKALVFSQFTSLLGLFGKALAKRKIKFEYLDGKTVNRAERVQNFQENEKIQLFLISLKAGGVGLNLTSADYVFILDPWWNPAAESQAIDRTHRYGQTKKVFAYRIIAKDTIEEKILALQEQKRALAKAMISTDKSLIKGMKMEDLRELFS